MYAVIYSGDRSGDAIYRDSDTRKTSPALYPLLGIFFLPLITTKCAALGVVLLNVNLGYNFL